jgi:hypothetical protein
MRRAFTLVELLVVVGTLVLLIAIFGGGGLGDALSALFLGWVTHTAYLLENLRVNSSAIWGNVVWSGLFAIGAHVFCRWLYGERNVHNPGGTNARWRIRWTMTGLLLLFLSFAAGTSVVALVHQFILMRGPDFRMYAYMDRFREMDRKEMSDYAARAMKTAAEQSWSANEWYAYESLSWDRSYDLRRHHHVLAFDDTDGKLAVFVLFHRSIDSRKEAGIVVGTREGARTETADQLASVLNGIAATGARPAVLPASVHYSEAPKWKAQAAETR